MVASANMLIIASILTLSGCFNSTSNGGKDKEQNLKILWEYAYDLDGGAPDAKPLLFGDMLITSGDKKITALSYDSGELIWKTPFDSHRQLMNRTFGLSSEVIMGTITWQFMAWNIHSGQSLWSIDVNREFGTSSGRGITQANGKLYVASQNRQIHEISTTGEHIVHQMGLRTYEMSYLNGVFFMTQRIEDRGVISAYDSNTFDLIWRFEPGNFGFGTREAPIIENGIVYVGTAGGPTGSINGFFALNAATGQEIWRKEGIQTFSAVLEGDFIYINDAGGIHKIRKDNGATVWHTNFGSSGTAPIAYGYGHIYAPHSGAMRILDAETGKIVHIISPPHGSYFWLVTADKGRIFAQSSRHLYAFAPWGRKEALE